MYILSHCMAPIFNRAGKLRSQASSCNIQFSPCLVKIQNWNFTCVRTQMQRSGSRRGTLTTPSPPGLRSIRSTSLLPQQFIFFSIFVFFFSLFLLPLSLCLLSPLSPLSPSLPSLYVFSPLSLYVFSPFSLPSLYVFSLSLSLSLRYFISISTGYLKYSLWMRFLLRAIECRCYMQGTTGSIPA